MGTGRKPVAAITYARPDLIPPNLRKIAAVNAMDGLQLVGFVDYDIAWFMPGDSLPPEYQPVGAVIYGPGDSIPAEMLRINSILSIPASGVAPPANSLGGAPVPMLKTGQTTQYSSELDDGFYEKGIAKRYTVLTAGQYSGTANIDLAHYAGGAGAISFTASTKKIADSGNGLAIFKTGDKIICSGAADPANIVILTVAIGNVAGEIVVTEAIADETPAGVVTISKREAHSNACVLDLNTGLMWSRTIPDKMGTASDGKMPWTGQLYDIFAYCAAANTASLGGYADWRVPNWMEALSIVDSEEPSAAPDSTAFPTWFTDRYMFTASTAAGSVANIVCIQFSTPEVSAADTATGRNMCPLVRGG